MLIDHYRKNLRAAVGASAGPYGYTLATWTTGAVVTNTRGLPDSLAALAFMAGAVLGFAFVGMLAFGGVTRRFDQEGGSGPAMGELPLLLRGARDRDSNPRGLLRR